MSYVSARYSNPERTEVFATDAEGLVWTMGVDSQVGDWVEYLREGKTISPYAAPPEPDWAAIDDDQLNRALVEEGSVVRALGMVMFAEINKLRVKNGDPAYTMNQFKNALKAEMR